MTKRFIKMVCIIIISLLELLSLSFYSIASSYGFETVDLPESQIEKIWENINLHKLDDFEVEENSLAIMSFDVSTNGNIVLGLQKNKILILNKNNDILDCFEFTNDGTFYVKWNNENVLLFMTRGTMILEFSLDGELVDMINVDVQNVNNNKLWNDVMYNTHVSKNGYSYNLKNNLGIFNLFTFKSYSQLIRSDENGDSIIIYDVNQNQLGKIISTIVLISLFACVCLLMVKNRMTEIRTQGTGIENSPTNQGTNQGTVL